MPQNVSTESKPVKAKLVCRGVGNITQKEN